MSDVAPSKASAGFSERLVIDALPRAVVVTDRQGRILLWNAPAEALYGWSEDEVLGRSVFEVLTPATEIEENRERFAFVSEGHAVTGDRTVVRRDGETVRVLTFTQPILDEAGETLAIVGASEDVTDLRLAEQRARDLAEHFQLAVVAGGLGTWRTDMTTGVTVWDERREALFGLPPGGFDGTFTTYMSLLHPEDREDVLTAVRDALDARSSYRIEHRVVWSDGSVRWIAEAGAVTVDEHGVATGTVGCAIDVTDRVTREAEKERVAADAKHAAELERLQRERLEFLGAINDALSISSNVHDVMVNVTTAAVPRLGDWCSIHVLTDTEALVPEVEVAHVDPEMVAYARLLQERFPYDPEAPTGIAHVIRSGETVFYPDITDGVIDNLDASDEEREIVSQLGLRSAIAVPLVKRRRVLGAMQFVMSSSSRRYTEDDVALANAVASRIASSLENHRLNEQQRVIAQILQRSLLPASLPDIPGVDIAVRYWPAGEATEVGGDFYDVFPLEPSDQWAVVIGDVCGTGPSAAALTGLARHSIRDSAWHGDRPTDVLSSLNRAVARSGTNTFLTALYATLDTSGARPELTVTSGGHPLPVHAGSAGVTTLGAPGTLLGVLEPGRFHTETTPLNPGDVVVFYTDGATDVPPPNCLTEVQFAHIVGGAATPGRGAEAVADQIHHTLDSIVPFVRRDDDIALLVLRVRAGDLPPDGVLQNRAGADEAPQVR